jgi:uncharacterized protein (DUF427 family)
MKHPVSPAGAAPQAPQRPEYVLEFLPCPKRVRVLVAGQAAADSLRAVLVRETGCRPVYYFPPEDVRRDWLKPTPLGTH